MFFQKFLTSLLTLSACFVVAIPSVHAQWYSHSFEVMGTSAKVELWSDSPSKAETLIKQVEVEMERINQLMSPYISSSELSKINAAAGADPLIISKELLKLIERSIAFSELSHGAFDITFASVGYKYIYRDGVAPSQLFIDEHKNLINYHSIKLDQQRSTILLEKQGMKIDLGGIAKGYAVDQCIDIIRQAGIQHAFVQAGGDSRVLGDKRGRLWTIGIRHPRQEAGVITQLPLANVAISTSGDYERFFIENGERVHHIIDPQTGRSSNKSVSVTIIANDSLTADALSTTVFILGAKKGLELIESMPEVSAIIIDAQGKFHYSSDFLAAN
ncbi:FAD:protein FMN transferase [Pleionea litopenaei]|uniref:FAD:protein FMN transferase n=1 Tax=Pleionea litopenaei TaxID=3070815 RepID=A0AA51RTY4_9GAMM|nr:FAD:protein FMN transferase [Pleionea sp. HL-JVS1]WMS87433.1 FAD:protein FMN transferase [Pleionea sp. HL-JVS1]